MESFPSFEIYCGGQFITTPDKLTVNNPYNGKLVAETWLAGPTQVEDAIHAASAVREQLSQMPVYQRYEILMQIATALSSLRQQFAELITLEAAKPISNSLAEVDRSIQTFTVAAEEAKRLPGEYMRLDWTVPGRGREALLKYFPAGIVAGISPFNFPLNLAVHKLAPAIAAGCPILLKPSTQTPLSTLMLAQIIDKTSLPKGAVSIMPMTRQTGSQLVTDSRIALLSFTGSPEVGWKMKNDAGRKKVVLELGGNAGVIVTQTADIGSAAGKCVAGAFSYAGQVCIHTQRIFVQHEIFDRFITEFSARTHKLVHGDPLDANTNVSVMIDQSNAIRVEAWVNEAVAGGAHLLEGGRREGSYMPPTVLTGTNASMKVCCEEVFGPVVIIEPFQTFDEGIQMLNAGKFGLQAGVFTDSLSEMHQAFAKLEIGGVIINDVPTFRVDHMPYGGVKDSGFGREGVKYAMMDMLEPRLLVKEM